MNVEREITINRRLIFAIIGFMIGSLISDFRYDSSNIKLKEEIVKLNKSNASTQKTLNDLRLQVLNLKNELIASRRDATNRHSNNEEISDNNLKSLKDTYELYKR